MKRPSMGSGAVAAARPALYTAFSALPDTLSPESATHPKPVTLIFIYSKSGAIS